MPFCMRIKKCGEGQENQKTCYRPVLHVQQRVRPYVKSIPIPCDTFRPQNGVPQERAGRTEGEFNNSLFSQSPCCPAETLPSFSPFDPFPQPYFHNRKIKIFGSPSPSIPAKVYVQILPYSN